MIVSIVGNNEEAIKSLAAARTEQWSVIKTEGERFLATPKDKSAMNKHARWFNFKDTNFEVLIINEGLKK
jgi:hypothetical protein